MPMVKRLFWSVGSLNARRARTQCVKCVSTYIRLRLGRTLRRRWSCTRSGPPSSTLRSAAAAWQERIHRRNLAPLAWCRCLQRTGSRRRSHRALSPREQTWWTSGGKQGTRTTGVGVTRPLYDGTVHGPTSNAAESSASWLGTLPSTRQAWPASRTMSGQEGRRRRTFVMSSPSRSPYVGCSPPQLSAPSAPSTHRTRLNIRRALLVRAEPGISGTRAKITPSSHVPPAFAEAYRRPGSARGICRPDSVLDTPRANGSRSKSPGQ